MRAAGPVLLGGRALPAWSARVISLLVPAVLAAMVATAVFGDGQSLVLDERAIGIAVAAALLLLRAPTLAVVAAAAAATALARLLV